MLKEREIKKSYRSDRDDIAVAFYHPMLRESISYDRASGYFTSGMLLFLLPALHRFVEFGRMRLVVSPDLTDGDVDAIQKGYLDREQAAVRSLERVVDRFLTESNKDAQALLSHLIRHATLDIRIAATSTRGIFHEKIGIFNDGRDAVAFTGSLNETSAGFSSNFESIDVYTSWLEPERVAQKSADFEALWHNQTPTIQIVTFPEYLKVRIIESAQQSSGTQSINSSIKELELRDYQRSAIAAWGNAGHRGILSMATGSGKTLTALHAARLALQRGVMTITILAPLKHLVEQWAAPAREVLGVDPIICHSDYEWRPHLKMALLLAQAKKNPLLLLSTYATAESKEFIDLTSRCPRPHMLIADEVHNVTPQSSDGILRDDYTFRLGLSATPERFEDEYGTALTNNYFGGSVFEYSLEEAIAAGFLTPYRYIPVFCTLTSREQVEYERLLLELDRHADSGTQGAAVAALKSKRLSLLQNAYDKLVQFELVFEQSGVMQDGFSLVYCHHALVGVVLRYIGMELGISAHTFTAQETLEERKDILDRFEAGDLKALVAIRCLDEGVDVPAVKTAFILNSSGNPKEFVQRRGRVLRRAPSKQFATIYDFIVLPSRSSQIEDKLLNRELSRFNEFASAAQNKQEAMLALEQKLAFEMPG